VVKLLQPLNAELPMYLTDSGIDIEVSPMQLENAPRLISVTVFGITIEDSPLQ
jgi:hypothetical protein